MSGNRLFTILFLTTTVFGIAAALMKIGHTPGSNILLMISLASTLGYALIGIKEVYNSKRLSNFQRMLWITCFIILNYLTALYYVLGGRGSVVAPRSR